MNKNLVVVAVVALAIGLGIGYYVPHGAAAATPSGGFAGRTGSFTRGGAGGGFLSGIVAKEDSGSITLNMSDGTSRVVLVTPDTTVSKSVDGTLSDVAVGSNIIVSGTTNSDGSVSANLIQVRPASLSANGSTPHPQ
ncbi:MAG TPA: hypothetical protein VMV50_03780 [Candidatus Paceibacterota bacterium]|nr:hypothetical protein [Candidatus Paceibacterota bacterium]